MSEEANAAAQPTSNAADPANANSSTPPASEPAKAPEAPAAASPEVKPEGGTAKPQEPKGPEKVVPEKYDLKAPENSVLDSRALERIAAYAKEQGLSQEEAQALVEDEHKTLSDYVDQKSKEWFEATKTDKELGGESLNQNVELAKRVVERFGSDALKRELNATGFGNHPEVVRVFARIGKAMSEDQLVIPGPQSGNKKSVEDMFYGNSQKQ